MITMCSKPKVTTTTVQAAPPTPTTVSNANADTASGDRQAASATRKKKGMASTVLSGQNSILGAINQATDSLKKTLG